MCLLDEDATRKTTGFSHASGKDQHRQDILSILLILSI